MPAGVASKEKPAAPWQVRRAKRMQKMKLATTRARRKPDNEVTRRIRLGDLQRLLRHRYRRNDCELTDCDAGREDLYELLLPISLGQGHARKMRNAIEIWAPWMSASEAQELIDQVNRTPDYMRKPKKRILGERMSLTDLERTALGIRTIAPIDMTDEQLKERRKAKDAERKWRKRRAARMKERNAWLANCKSRLKPWKKAGISRPTWYRRQAKLVRQVSETGVSAIKITIGEDRLVSRSKVRGSKRKSRKQRAA